MAQSLSLGGTEDGLEQPQEQAKAVVVLLPFSQPSSVQPHVTTSSTGTRDPTHT